jgi:hypothetical protein
MWADGQGTEKDEGGIGRLITTHSRGRGERALPQGGI